MVSLQFYYPEEDNSSSVILQAHTYFSLRYGTISPKELVLLMQRAGYSSITVTDVNNTSACMDVIREAKKRKLNPLVGVDFKYGVSTKYVVIAKNNLGFEIINHFLSSFLKKKGDLPDRFPNNQHVFIIYPFTKYGKFTPKENEFFGVKPYELNRLQSVNTFDQKKLVCFPAFSFRHKRDHNIHRLLRAIDNNTLLSKLEPTQEASERDKIIPINELYNLYGHFPLLLENAKIIAEQSTIDFDDGSEVLSKNLTTFTGSHCSDMQLLKKLCEDGVRYRYPQAKKEIYTRIEKEMMLIEQKGFTSYFLINWDLVRYARKQGYYYVGRGSGANSIVAYLLRITDVDPIELDLYFERFINLYRKNPPDFDIDFSWKDRDDVINYLFSKYKHVALLGTYNTFQKQSVIRELGKVFGLPKHEIDQLGKKQFFTKKRDHIAKLVVKYSAYIKGFPSHLSVHAGGILISEKPIQYYTATFMPPKGLPTTQFDMVVAEDIGLHKFDILSQRGLGKIKDAVDIIHKNNPELDRIDIHDIKRFKEDEKIKVLLRNAKAIGCFYVESPAMRMLLTKLRVDDYLGLVAASSVIRPGVAKSGMMKEYIKRFRSPESRKDIHPVLQKIMPETFGVMVYQEDVIKVAHYYGGLDLGEADMLRRGMSGKFRSRDEFLKVKNLFFSNAIEAGNSPDDVAEIWRQIESFAGYAFAKGHSASYAVESYQCLFLKAYFPLEYMVATINNFGGFYRTEMYVHEAKMNGGTIKMPCVNNSHHLTTIKGTTIYLGFQHVQSLEKETIDIILYERKLRGPFGDFDDFSNRLSISVDQAAILIRINAFRFSGKTKQELLWEAHFKLEKKAFKSVSPPLFSGEKKSFIMPQLETSSLADMFDEMEFIGFSLKTPFRLLKNPLQENVLANNFACFIDKNITVIGYLVAVKKTSTSSGKPMFFGTFLDRDGQFIDTVHFPMVGYKYPFRGKGLYRLYATVKEDYDHLSLEIISMEKLEIIEDPRYSEESPSQKTLNSIIS